MTDTQKPVEALIAEMRADVCGHLHRIEGRSSVRDKMLETVVELVEAHGRALETLTNELEKLNAAKRTSERARSELSDSDLKHESDISKEIVARKGVEAKVDALTEMQQTQLAILGRLDRFAANPSIKVILTVVAAVALSWAASKGITTK